MNLYHPYVRQAENSHFFSRLPVCGDLIQAQHIIRSERSKKGCTAKLVLRKNDKKYVLMDSCTNYTYGYIEEEQLCQLPIKTHTRR